MSTNVTTYRGRLASWGAVGGTLLWLLNIWSFSRHFGAPHRWLIVAVALPVAILQTGVVLLIVNGVTGLFRGNGVASPPGMLTRRCLATVVDISVGYCGAVLMALALTAFSPKETAGVAAIVTHSWSA